MQRHIDQTLVDGAYLHLHFDEGDVEKLYPTEAHPMILKLGSVFVLCSNFVKKNGDEVNVDFYLAPHREGYVMFRSVIENRRPLAQLMKDAPDTAGRLVTRAPDQLHRTSIIPKYLSGITAKFLLFIVPIFLSLSAIGFALSLNFNEQQDVDALGTRLGNQAGRIVIALSPHRRVEEPRLLDPAH